MRDYLFRGKCIDNSGYRGKWVTGSLWVKENHVYISLYEDADFLVEVDPETVGQFTGLHDKNGVKIFEGDILECKIRYGMGTKLEKEHRVVLWEDRGFCTKIITSRYSDGLSPGSWSLPEIQAFISNKVIGNIHDNPELLKV